MVKTERITEKQLSLRDTLPSGQCFRFSECNGVWTVKAGVGANLRVLQVSQDDLSPITEDPFWAHFFDLETAANDTEEFIHVIEKILQLCDLWAERIKGAMGSDGGEKQSDSGETPTGHTIFRA